MFLKKMKKTIDCDKPMDVTETTILDFTCKVCGYRKQLIAKKQYPVDNDHPFEEDHFQN